MVYLYDACDQISDFCHQQLLRKISWTDGRMEARTDRGKTVYVPRIINVMFYISYEHYCSVVYLFINYYYVFVYL
jgi:hypothetical protein